MTAPLRPSQLSLVEGMERPVGPLPLSVMTGTNADLIAKVAPMYLTGSVLDVTYGEGKWWDRFTPDPFTHHDKFKGDGVDFTDLPHDDDSFDAVCFDPPYVAAGGVGTTHEAVRHQERYGIGHTKVAGTGGVRSLILAGLAECCRVARSFVLVKCMEYASAGLQDVPNEVTNAARELGWVKHDLIVHNTGTGPGGHNITTIKRARRAHSYLLVFTKAAR